MIAPRSHDNRPFVIVTISLVGLAWLVLIAWGASPYSRFLSHEAIGHARLGLSPDYGIVAAVFLAAWVLMSTGMMLPTTMPLLLLFRRFVSARHNAAGLTAVLIGGYLLVWVLFGAAAHLGDLAIHLAIAGSRYLAERSWLLGPAVLALAGVYQFTPLKDFCLEKCRSPYSFIVGHWHGRTPVWDALLLGLHHGLYCVGCCWSLMLLMFALGAGNLLWMMALGAVMGIEKNFSWGRRLSTPLGIVLLAIAGALVFANAGVSVACAHDGGIC